jgi:hypothetical protein
MFLKPLSLQVPDQMLEILIHRARNIDPQLVHLTQARAARLFERMLDIGECAIDFFA